MRMFEHCPLKGVQCGFAGYRGKDLHCGVQTGVLEETKVKNMTKCPKKIRKKRR